jgi:PAS domain S-box-containing protein
MTSQGAKANGGWTSFQGLIGHDAGASAATSDLIDILDAVEVPIVVLQRDFRIACFNEAAADALGLAPPDVGRAASDVAVLGQVTTRLERQCSQAIADGVDSRVDFRDGDRWFVVRVSPYPRGNRQATGTLLTFTNVTAFRASVDQAIYERECTKAILNTVGDPLVVLSADQRIQSGNRAFYTMFGVSRDDTQGVPLWEIGNRTFDLASLRHELNEMLTGGHPFQPVEVGDVGTVVGRRTMLLDARPLSFPGHSERRALVTFQDITARKQAEVAKDLRTEEELRRSEAFLAEAQRLSLTGSFSWKVATDEISWSEQLYRIFEFELGTAVTIQRITGRVHPEDVPMMSERIEQARVDGADFEYAVRLLMPDRSVRHVTAIAHARRNGEGQLEYIGAVQDVTQRRSSEEALSRARSELAQVARVTSLGVLTASIAHEVNQPLSGIVTNASTCLRMLAADTPNVEGACETARRTIRDANRAADVITRLRALFSKKDPVIESVDINEAAREVVALSLSRLHRNKVTLRLMLADDLPTIPADRVQLQQVMLNLLWNASDAMRTVEDRPRELVIRTERDEHDHVRLAVRDSGVGFDPQHVESLFDPFHTTKPDGMGIGLSVSRSIIESHEGRIWATLNDGPGATFSFSVPRGRGTPSVVPMGGRP